MNTPTPIPIFIPISKEEPKCPNCGKPEKIVQKCGHCGYEYPEEEGSIKDGIVAVSVIVGIVILVIWIVLTFMYWTMSFSHPTLIEVLQGEWEWLSGLFGRII